MVINSMNPYFVKDMSPITVAVYNIFLRSFVINNMANPIIYGFCDKKFRSECTQFGLTLFTCGRHWKPEACVYKYGSNEWRNENRKYASLYTVLHARDTENRKYMCINTDCTRWRHWNRNNVYTCTVAQMWDAENRKYVWINTVHISEKRNTEVGVCINTVHSARCWKPVHTC